ncbi:MAG: hypothetical protein ACE5WD_09285, partial [Candidatus Aminicenantia bacterium]
INSPIPMLRMLQGKQILMTPSARELTSCRATVRGRTRANDQNNYYTYQKIQSPKSLPAGRQANVK